MTIRPALSAAVLAAVLAAPASAQRFVIPDSLAYLGLPNDPAEHARRVARGATSVRLHDLYLVGGCVSDGGWTTAAFEAMYRIAESDPAMRSRLASPLGSATNRLREFERPCASDLPGFEAWLIGALRLEWETGLLSHPFRMPSAWWGLFRAVGNSGNPETRSLVRDIAFDPAVRERVRVRAAHTMLYQRMAQMPGWRLWSDEERLERRWDQMEAMIREHGDDLPRRWIALAKSELHGNGRIIGRLQ